MMWKYHCDKRRYWTESINDRNTKFSDIKFLYWFVQWYLHTKTKNHWVRKIGITPWAQGIGNCTILYHIHQDDHPRIETYTNPFPCHSQPQDPWHPLTRNNPTKVALAVSQAGQTPVEAYVGIKKAYLVSFGWELVGWSYQASPGTNLHTMSGSCVPPIFAISRHFAQFSSCTPSQYLAGRRVFAPFDQEIPNPGSMEKACVGHGFSWSNTRVDPTRWVAVNFPYQGLLVQTYIRCHGSFNPLGAGCALENFPLENKKKSFWFHVRV
jgi:hypothetical protein